VEDNDPELIRRAVIEMFARLESQASKSDEVFALRSRADEIYEANGVVGRANLAAEFVHRYAEQIK
jgi:hypothetical protein